MPADHRPIQIEVVGGRQSARRPLPRTGEFAMLAFVTDERRRLQQ
jgi:hypothetical protein